MLNLKFYRNFNFLKTEKLLDIIDLDKILTVNSMWENKFSEPWAKMGAALVWNLWENQNKKNEKRRNLLNMMFPNFFMLIVRHCSSQEQSEYKVLFFMKNFYLVHFTRKNLWSKQSGTLHIASWLFLIFHEVTSMKKNVNQILLWNFEK